MKLLVRIDLKEDIFDPQGVVIFNSLKNLGFKNISSVRQGKIIEIDLDETSEKQAMVEVNKMCDKLLVNKIIETFSIEKPN